MNPGVCKKSVLLVVIIFITCISAAGAFQIQYTGLDKVDMSWGQAGENFRKYEILRDDSVVETIYDVSETKYRDMFVTPGFHDYVVRTVTDDGSYDSVKIETYVGEPRGTLLCGNDRWASATFTLGGNVNLGGYYLDIFGCTVTSGGNKIIGGTGEIEVTSSNFEGVEIDVTAPGASLYEVSSDREIVIRGEGGNSANGVEISWDVAGDNVLKLYGDNNRVENCSAEIDLQGNDAIIEDCKGQYAKISATGDNVTIRNNVLRNVRGYAIYVSGNQINILSNTINNASDWDKSYYDTQPGTGIQLSDCLSDTRIFDNTIIDAEENAIYTYLSYDGTMTGLTIESNTIVGGGYGIMNRAPISGLTMVDNRIDGCSDWMLYNVGESDHATIKENSFENITGGVQYHGDYSYITGNTFTLIDYWGLSVSSDDNGGYIVVSGNTITGISEDNSDRPDAIDFEAANSVLEGNTILDCYNGIDAMYKDNMTVRNNKIYDCRGEWGIYFTDTHSGLVENNTLVNTSTGGSYYTGIIYLQDVGGTATVKDNVIEGYNVKNGIYGEHVDDGLVIENNTVGDVATYGIKLYQALNGDPYDHYRGKAEVSVRNNSINGGFTGLGCFYVDNATFVENNISSGSYGIWIGDANNLIVSMNSVVDVETGIRVEDSAGTVINANIFNVTQYGGQFYDPLNNFIVAGNSFSGYANTGIELEDCEQTTFSNNLLRGSGTDIYLKTPQGELMDTLLLEENTVGEKYPTKFTISDINEPIIINAVEDPPEPPSPPEYRTTKSSIGKWLQIWGEFGVGADAQMNLTFYYSADDVKNIEESTLSIWKYGYNSTAGKDMWDPGNDPIEPWNGTRWHDMTNHDIGVAVEKLCIFAPLGGQPVHNLRLEKDYNTIKEALDDLEFKDGDTITVDEGYTGTKENIDSYSEFKLKSSSGAPASVTLTAEDPFKPTVRLSGSDVEIDGFVITGATGSQGVRMEGCDNSKITNCRIEGNFFGAIICEDEFDEISTDCKITDCTITGNDHGAIYINQSKDSDVIDCTLSGAVGIGLEHSENSYISGNTLTDCTDYGITDNFGKNNEITGNSVTGGELGIYVYGSESGKFEDNTVTDTTGPGILLEDTEKCTFTGDSVTGSPLGVGLEDSDDNTFTGTSISGTGAGGSDLTGIDLHGADGNTFTRCSVSDFTSPGYAVCGIIIDGAAYGNAFEECRISGLEASRSDGARITASSNVINNCTFTDIRGAAGGASGIFTGVNSTGNVIRKSTFSGIYATENATAFQVKGSKTLTITVCDVGSVEPVNTSTYAIFENSDYSNVIESTALGTLADIHELRVDGDLKVSKPISIPPDTEDIQNIGHYLNLSTGSSAEVWISFDYTDADLDGKNPALLSVYRNDGSGWQQLALPNGVNTNEKYVYADNITEFSVFAPMWSGKGLPEANFTGTPLEGAAPLEVGFTDESVNAVQWAWTFGDGGTSAEQNPVHTYTDVGIYTVSLTATNNLGSDTLTRTDYITVRDVPPEPAKKTENMAMKDNGTSVAEVGGNQQVSFNSTTSSGGEVSGDSIVLRNNGINVTIETDGLTNTSGEYTGNVTGVNLLSDPMTSDVGGDVGTASFSFNASMPRYNPDAVIETSLYERPSDRASTAFSLVAAQDGLNIDSTAYAVYISKSNLTAGDSISNAVLRFTAGEAWVDANGGKDAVRVMREADNGTCYFLETRYVGDDGLGNMIFEAISPDGFSAFALLTVSKVPAPQQGVTSVSSSSGGGGSGSTVVSAADDVQAGVPVGFPVDGGPVYETYIIFDKDLASVMITVDSGTALPGGVAMAPSYELYRYLTFEMFKADPSDVTSAEIGFAVPLSLVSGRDVYLLHYTDGEWVRLSTVKTGEKDGNALYTAETPSFSSFAIVFDEPAVGTPTPKMTKTGEGTGDGVVTSTGTPTPATSPGFMLSLPVLLIAGAVLVLRREAK